MTDRELMQQSLDLLEDINQCSLPPTGIFLPAEIDHVMETLRARLAQPESVIQARKEGNLIVVDLPQVPTGGGGIFKDEQPEPLEYWNAVEGWVKIDEMHQHFDTAGCGTIYKTGGEGRIPLYTTPPKPEPMIDGWPLYSGLPPFTPSGGSGEIESQKIYRTIKQREWVGLTAQDLADVGPENYIGAIWADAKLKEKNEN
jgi:hypothetical protein